MSEELSIAPGALRKRLDEAEVLRAVVLQLGKDMAVEELPLPPADDGAFETLRAAVLVQLTLWQAGQSGALSRAINRIDLTEQMVEAALQRGGPPELAGMMVLRALQKVLLRKHFS